MPDLEGAARACSLVLPHWSSWHEVTAEPAGQSFPARHSASHRLLSDSSLHWVTGSIRHFCHLPIPGGREMGRSTQDQGRGGQVGETESRPPAHGELALCLQVALQL